MAVLLALGSALAYGLSDFVGGLVSRRASAWAVAVLGQLSATACTALVALRVGGSPGTDDLACALLAGVGSGVGTGFLYRGFAAGRMSVVAPVSAVGAAVVPVLVGTLGGERPSAWVWLGILLALPGIWLVAREPDPPRPDPAATAVGLASLADGLTDGILAGLGFGVLFSALGQIPDSAGWWPLTTAQAVSVPTVVLLAVVLRAPWVPRGRPVRWALAAGPLGATATGCFLLATQQGYLTIAGVLASLYPATTVLLAAALLHERIHRAQGVGLGLCGAAITLVVVG
ncbi:DMT family transporter [Nocardioides mesophilus]|uniref:DMT family transporter n=1 Tax=Nocardioides mesophilus TaxID=433659 RepID=A0A7G9RBN5_9ACTN|nr:DMT family transporter [Nocardioides mesophilus]QNN53010.1 DMT family transporter [Nocardioides mesophilus]